MKKDEQAMDKQLAMTVSEETAAWAVTGLKRLRYASAVDGLEDWAMMLRAADVDAKDGDADGAQADATDARRNVNADVWIVNLHGHGSTGDQLYTRQDIRKNWLPHFTSEGYSIISPNLRGNAWMSPAAVADLHGLLGYLREQQQAKKFILASGSMGGTGNLIYATQHPEDIAGVVALCPATDLPGYLEWTAGRREHPVIGQIHDAIVASYQNDAQAIAKHSVRAQVDKLTMPVCVIHGDNDSAIPVEESRELARVMADRQTAGEPTAGGADFSYRELEGGNHDAPLWHMAEALAWVRHRVK